MPNIWRKHPSNRLRTVNFIRQSSAEGSEKIVEKFFTAEDTPPVDNNILVFNISLELTAEVNQLLNRNLALGANVVVSDVFNINLPLSVLVGESADTTPNIWRKQPSNRLRPSNFIRKTPVDGSEKITQKFFTPDIFTPVDNNLLRFDAFLELSVKILDSLNLDLALSARVINTDAFNLSLPLSASVRLPFSSLQLTCHVYTPTIYTETQAVVQKPKISIT